MIIKKARNSKCKKGKNQKLILDYKEMFSCLNLSSILAVAYAFNRVILCYYIFFIQVTTQSIRRKDKNDVIG